MNITVRYPRCRLGGKNVIFSSSVFSRKKVEAIVIPLASTYTKLLTLLHNWKPFYFFKLGTLVPRNNMHVFTKTHNSLTLFLSSYQQIGSRRPCKIWLISIKEGSWPVFSVKNLMLAKDLKNIIASLLGARACGLVKWLVSG